MKYIRTKDGIKTISGLVVPCPQCLIDELKENGYLDEVINQADTIEELCDEFVIKVKTGCFITHYDKTLLTFYAGQNGAEVYGAIWTDKGLIYVAKMNDKGELELL